MRNKMKINILLLSIMLTSFGFVMSNDVVPLEPSPIIIESSLVPLGTVSGWIDTDAKVDVIAVPEVAFMVEDLLRQPVLHSSKSEVEEGFEGQAVQADEVPKTDLPEIKKIVIESTFAMIKPDAVAAKNSGKIIDMIEANGFDIVRMQKIQMSEKTAREFYAVHKERSFFEDLIKYITSGPIIIMVLSKENAVADWRKLIGSTDPAKADEGTIRKLFGTNMSHNAVHGSDSVENARLEAATFFCGGAACDENALKTYVTL
jgi:nucleoside-diphosphate kinase